MQAVQPENSNNNKISLEPRGMSGDTKKEMKMTAPTPKK
jgi:hypothetical protein